MSTVLFTPATLPKNLQPFLLGSPQSKAPLDLKEKIDAVFAKGLQCLNTEDRVMDGIGLLQSRDYVFDAGDWVLKSARTGNLGRTPESLQDLLIHRVTQIEMLRSFVTHNKLEEAFHLPQKYLYWNESQRQFYVVAEKLELSDEIAKPHAEIEQLWRAEGFLLGGQLKKVGEGAQQRTITALQARSLAQMSFLGYSDLTYNNLFFDKEGKIAIIDSEPLKKIFYNNLNASWLKYVADRSGLVAQHGLIGTAKLKTYCPTPELLQEVEKVEKSHVLWYTAETITKLVLVVIVFKVTAGVAIPFGSVAFVAIKVAAKTVLILKGTLLLTNGASVHYFWHLSHKSHPNFAGLNKLSQIESTGRI